MGLKDGELKKLGAIEIPQNTSRCEFRSSSKVFGSLSIPSDIRRRPQYRRAGSRVRVIAPHHLQGKINAIDRVNRREKFPCPVLLTMTYAMFTPSNQGSIGSIDNQTSYSTVLDWQSSRSGALLLALRDHYPFLDWTSRKYKETLDVTRFVISSNF